MSITMTDHLVIAIFPSRRMLSRGLDHLLAIEQLAVEHAAIVTKARDGEIVVLGDELGPNEGSLTGGTLGAAIAALGIVQFGALALPGVGAIVAIGAAALVGALVGGTTGRLAANLLESTLPNEALADELADDLQHGRHALILRLTDADSVSRVRIELQAFRAELRR